MPIGTAVGQACDTTCIGGCLEPGSYYVLISTSDPIGSVNCVNGDYVATLDCQPCTICGTCDPLIAFQEGEACPNLPDMYNGGCLGGVEYVTPIQCGEDVCGTSWGEFVAPNPYIFRDRDIYELVLTQYDSVVWTAVSNVPVVIEILEPLPGCAGTISWATSYYTLKCDTATASICLPPGRYWLSIRGYANQGYCEPYTASVRCYPCSECVECPVSSIPEGEPCPNFNDQYNAGCHSSPPTAVRVQCGDTICGSATYYDLPDHDFYEITIATRDTVTWCVEAEYPVAAAILTPNAVCSAMIVHAQGNAPACVPLCLSICLPPGTYWLYVRPTVTFGTLNPIACKRYVASIHCAPCPTGQTCTYADLDFDPANNTCSFNNIQLACNDTVCGEIESGAAADQDWYTFEIPFGTPCVLVTANVYGNDTPGYFPFGQGLDPGVAIYQGDCTTLVGQDNNSGVGNDAMLTTTCLPPGWYHVRVGGFSGSVGPYVLSLSCTPCPCPPPCNYQDRDIEPGNNTCTSAPAEFICDDTLCGEIRLGPAPDEDWYLFFVFGPNCQRLTLDVFANGTPGYFGYLAGLDPIIELWDPTCTTQLTLDDNSGISNDARLISGCLTPGTYRIKIAGVAGTTGPYVFAAHCDDCPCNGQCPYPSVDFDPANDLCASTNPMLFCADTACGEIIYTQPGLPFDRDWYQISVPAGSCQSLTIDAFGDDTPPYATFGGGLDPTLWLYASDCSTLLEFDYDSGIGTDSKITSGCLAPGVYNVLVESTTGSNGPYILAIGCTTCQCPCSLTCNPNLPLEGELCPNLAGDFYNGGCLTNPPTFLPIACGSRFCGTSFAMGGLRDTDWFQFTLAVPRRINWKVSAEFPFEMGIYKPNPNCSNLQTIRYTTGQQCETKQHIVKCLAAGTYYFYIAPTVYNGVPCAEYRSQLTCGKCFIDHLVIHQVAADIHLLWDPDETEPVYTIYRSSVSEFEPSQATMIATTTEPSFIDAGVLSSGAEKYFYVVTMDAPSDLEP